MKSDENQVISLKTLRIGILQFSRNFRIIFHEIFAFFFLNYQS